MSTEPVLSQINLVVSDMEATAAFYRRLGIDVPDASAEWSDDHRAATLPGGFELELDSVQSVARWNEGWPSGGTGCVLGFRVGSSEAVDAAHAELIQAGGTSQQAPFDAFWGARYAVVADPDGNAVGIMGPREGLA